MSAAEQGYGALMAGKQKAQPSSTAMGPAGALLPDSSKAAAKTVTARPIRRLKEKSTDERTRRSRQRTRRKT